MSDAALLRATISTILGRDAEHAILAPGALVALRLFLHRRGASVLVLSDAEYYGPEHFPEMDVHVASLEEFASVCERVEPDAVLVSVVSWKGGIADIGALARDLAPRSGGRRPLLCVDWCQAGAIGFPSTASLDADLILGDASKWLTPPTTPDRLAFLLARDELTETLRSCFGGLYLSGGRRGLREARWVDPEILAGTVATLSALAVDRSRLHAWHDENMRLAAHVAEANGRAAPDSAILWFPGWPRADVHVDAIPHPELVWDTGTGVRVLCQAAPR